MRLRRKSLALPRFVAVFSALAAAGCESLTAPLATNHTEEIRGYTDAAAIVQAYAETQEAMDYSAYEDLLHVSFEFHPRDSDFDDYPWLPGASWGIHHELEIVSNMFDPNYSGSEPPVQSIALTPTVVSTQDNDDGSREATVLLSGTILTSPTDGWAFDTRLTFHLVPVDGYLRIREIRELERIRTGVFAEDSSYGSIRALYLEDPGALP